ncbi:hypothetical protein KSC_073130 [Ktedonobacter sp. SOSP1-52]|uniref:WD40 repeat domain-containing protein n=1 Tax=Ktedonobacter sp. SOSP1-52 TaxID=2778366 RepID=UPI0019153452|nr:PD40 domain-containing protein [Ktedonobacter sp. SOSP1-52]GHO68421.1 hypothetical protein KSC_073130 [Ktedonobacter sp. SOSP1-52]
MVGPRLIYRGHHGFVHGVAWSPDGTRIASASADRTIQVWKASSGEAVLVYRGHKSAVWAIAWSPDGTRIVSISEDQTVQIWEARNGIVNLLIRAKRFSEKRPMKRKRSAR